ncbi:type III secretion protein [Escherichia coli]|nr:type III secretion protein [Escherichia coli]
MTIMYNPASYTHTSHLPELLRHEHQNKTLLNFWLLRHGKLCHLPDNWHPADIALSHLLSCWQQLPIVAHLTGGYLLRHRLLEQSALLMTDPRLLAFISLPLLHTIKLDDNELPLDTVSCGLTFILGQFPSLPEALRQRLQLLFPAGITPAPFSAFRTLHHINLLQMALTYAYHY